MEQELAAYQPNSPANCIRRIAFDVILRKLQGKQVEEHVIVGESIVIVYVVVDSSEWRVAFHSDCVGSPVFCQELSQEV